MSKLSLDSGSEWNRCCYDSLRLGHPRRKEQEHKQAVGLDSGVTIMSNDLGGFEEMSFIIYKILIFEILRSEHY